MKIFSTLFAAAAVLAAALLAPPAAVANDDLWNPQFGGRFILGVYPGSKSNATTATASSGGAATINNTMGVVTSAALTTAAGATQSFTITDSYIAAGDIVIAEVGNGTNTQGTPNVATITPSAGQVVVVMQNIHASQALNGTVTVSFYVLKFAYAQ